MGLQFGASTDKPVPADFTGDGKTDIAFWRPSTGEWFVLRSEDSTYFAFPFGSTNDIPRPADYDGDGKADPAVLPAESISTWFILRSSDGGVTSAQFGISSDMPEPADYDGDGKADVAIYRQAQGQWWYLRSSERKCVRGDLRIVDRQAGAGRLHGRRQGRRRVLPSVGRKLVRAEKRGLDLLRVPVRQLDGQAGPGRL